MEYVVKFRKVTGKTYFIEFLQPNSNVFIQCTTSSTYRFITINFSHIINHVITNMSNMFSNLENTQRLNKIPKVIFNQNCLKWTCFFEAVLSVKGGPTHY